MVEFYYEDYRLRWKEIIIKYLLIVTTHFLEFPLFLIWNLIQRVSKISELNNFQEHLAFPIAFVILSSIIIP